MSKDTKRAIPIQGYTKNFLWFKAGWFDSLTTNPYFCTNYYTKQ